MQLDMYLQSLLGAAGLGETYELCQFLSNDSTLFPVNERLQDQGGVAGGVAGIAGKGIGRPISHYYIAPILKMACKQNLDLGCVLISDPGTLGTGAKISLDSRTKKFTPYCNFRPGQDGGQVRCQHADAALWRVHPQVCPRTRHHEIY